MKLPSTLSKNYCGYFLDTSLKCNFGGSCKKEHTLFSLGFQESDISPMIEFVDATRGLK